MKRIFAWILALLVAVSLFAGCDLSEKTYNSSVMC